MPLSHGTEADSRRYRHLRLLEQQLGEFERSEMTKAFGQRRPEEHRAARLFDRPAGALESGHQHVAALLVHRTDLTRLVAALTQRDDRGDLNGLEDTVIEIALDA